MSVARMMTKVTWTGGSLARCAALLVLAAALPGCGARGEPGTTGLTGGPGNGGPGDPNGPGPGTGSTGGRGGGGRPSPGSSGGRGSTGGTATGGCSSPQEVLCRGLCVDLSFDPSNCGGCGRICPPGLACAGGECLPDVPDPGSCPSGETYCPNFGQCLHLPSNSFACGSCNTPCRGGTACVDGKCDPGLCIQTLTPCSELGALRCVDASSDSANCGGCGRICAESETCTEGRCGPIDCGEGAQYCSGWGCTDTSYDIARCGGCQTNCPTSSIFDYDAYQCNSGVCGCSGFSNPCGAGCTTEFWYCPSPGFPGDPLELCTQLARTGYQNCACNACLPEIEACADSPSCMNSMDCSLRSPCLECGPDPFSHCGDQNGELDRRAEALVSCMNASCARF